MILLIPGTGLAIIAAIYLASIPGHRRRRREEAQAREAARAVSAIAAVGNLAPMDGRQAAEFFASLTEDRP